MIYSKIGRVPTCVFSEFLGLLKSNILKKDFLEVQNSFARLFRYPLLAMLIKNFIKSLNLVLDVINDSNMILELFYHDFRMCLTWS